MRKRSRLARLADEQLMELVAERDVSAFELFYERHAAAGYSLAYRMVGDARSAEDVTQEAFLSIWRSKAGYDPVRGSVRSWALGIVRNRAIDAMRRDTAKRMPLTSIEGTRLIDEQPSGIDTESEAIRRETALELRGALGRLPVEQSRVLELAYFGGFSQTEIAEILGTPLGTVKGRMRLALEKIRSNLSEGLR